MKTPPLLLGAAFVFWGLHTGMIIPGVLMAAVAEGARIAPWRWDFSPKDMSRAADLCAVLFMGILAFRLSGDRSVSVVLGLIQLAPLPFFPLLALQNYGVLGGVDNSALFYRHRMARKRNPDLPRTAVDISYPCVLACVLSASAANPQSLSYFAGVLVFIAWALWTERPGGRAAAPWLALVATAGLIGYGGQAGLHAFQGVLEQWAMDWYSRALSGRDDAFRSVTALGGLGSLKQSGRIVMRMEARPGQPAPGYLRAACYTHFISGTWIAFQSGFESLEPGDSGTDWVLAPRPETSREIAVSMHLKKGEGLLSLPNGAFVLSGLPVGAMERNAYNAVRASGGPGFIRFQVRYGPGAAQVRPPGPEDFNIPEAEAPVIQSLAHSLGMSGMDGRRKVQAVMAFFSRDFRYSLILRDKGDSRTALERFLTQTRKGHCEYFATAAVLMLRAAGVPARYATGFSVQERGRGGQWIIRSRHAHAWVLAYVDGQWIDVDTTPGIWADEEAKSASPLQGLRDAFSWVWWRFSQWRWREKGEAQGVAGHLSWLLIPLMVWLGWRLFVKERIKRGRKAVSRETGPRPGMDSEFYLIARRLEHWGFGRQPHENWSLWLSRLEASSLPAPLVREMEPIVRLHQQYRFAPAGLSGDQRNQLRDMVRSWLARYPESRPMAKETKTYEDIGNHLHP